MNSSVYSADRATHLRIIIAALLASIGMVVFALAVHVDPDEKYAAVVRIPPAQKAALVDQAAPMLPTAGRRI
jgi:hypothetical protein